MTPELFNEFTSTFSKLKEKVDGILSFEYGTNNSLEGKDQGTTHAIIITFRDAACRDAYLVHPEHVRFAQEYDRWDLLQELTVVDYTPGTI